MGVDGGAGGGGVVEVDDVFVDVMSVRDGERLFDDCEHAIQGREISDAGLTGHVGDRDGVLR